jgi:hypothetical protein
MLAWKLTQEAITRMRQADYDIEVGRGWFDFVCRVPVLSCVVGRSHRP